MQVILEVEELAGRLADIISSLLTLQLLPADSPRAKKLLIHQLDYQRHDCAELTKEGQCGHLNEENQFWHRMTGLFTATSKSSS